MSRKSGSTASKKTTRKPKVHKETIRDLQPVKGRKEVKGGAMVPIEHTVFTRA